jgi:hypothetical protein
VGSLPRSRAVGNKKLTQDGAQAIIFPVSLIELPSLLRIAFP